MMEVPHSYYIHLKLDPILSQKQSKLVFSMSEKSSSVEFSQENFTIEDLEKEHQSNLEQMFRERSSFIK